MDTDLEVSKKEPSNNENGGVMQEEEAGRNHGDGSYDNTTCCHDGKDSDSVGVGQAIMSMRERVYVAFKRKEKVAARGLRGTDERLVEKGPWIQEFGYCQEKVLRIAVFAFLVVYVVLDIAIEQPENLVSVAGLAIFLLIFYLTSVNPAMVNWHTVFWGIALQYLFALLILRTTWGYNMFKWLGDRVTEFLNHAMAGVLFAFGTTYEDHFFAMKAVIRVLGRSLSFCMGTTPGESISAAANIFLGMNMTKSELHAIMVGGPEHNIIEAASNGATASLKMIGSILVNVIAFLSLLAFLNATLAWIGYRLICSYVLFPVSFFMGVETSDCRKVAELVGVKTFTNEFIAYSKLKVLIANRKALTNYTDVYNATDWYWNNNDIILNTTGQILDGGIISEKSEIISTYALCGFANFGSIGITLGGFGALAPTRRPELTKMNGS
ncbi:S28A1-like protein [Mya arenaria]|uniref:S28A1-like protein n=1 Tax=Mya arenaria TaxID=6604 RepID=A0ABY7DA67_MYAAR|nr:S28A1-like protein [Mya arenaria]